MPSFFRRHRARRAVAGWVLRHARLGVLGLLACALGTVATTASAQRACESIMFDPSAVAGAPSARLSRSNAAFGNGQRQRIDGLEVVRVEGESIRAVTNQIMTLGDYFLCADADDAPAVLTTRKTQDGSLFDFSVGLSWPGSVADALDGHAHTVQVRDWFQTLGLAGGYSGNDAPFMVMVGSGLTKATDSASFSPAQLRGSQRLVGTVSFSSPEDCSALPGRCIDERPEPTLSAALDVVAHEWAHGITYFHSRLAYQRESGAVNEAFSDWMAVAADFALSDGDWLIGEDVDAIRNVRQPWEFNHPSVYQGAAWRPADAASCPQPVDNNDQCGVHANSGVGNRMFGLLSEGGRQHGIALDGIGVERAIRVALAAQEGGYWAALSDYHDAAQGMVAAAAPFGSVTVEQVRKAWQAVCVLSPEDRCPDDTLLWPEWAFFEIALPSRLVWARFYPSAATKSGCLVAIPGGALSPKQVRARPECRLDAVSNSAMRFARPLPNAVPGSTTTVSLHLWLEGEKDDYWMLAYDSVTLEDWPTFRPQLSTGSASLSLEFDADAPGELLVLVTEDSETVASAYELRRHRAARRQRVLTGRNRFVWNGLREGRRYAVYATTLHNDELRSRRHAVHDSSARVQPDWTMVSPPRQIYASALFARRGLELEPASNRSEAVESPTLHNLQTAARHTTLHWDLEANMSGQVYYLALPADSASSAQMDHARMGQHAMTRVAQVTPGTNTLEWQSLDAASEYVLFAFLHNDAGDDSTLVRSEPMSTGTALVLSATLTEPLSASQDDGAGGSGSGPALVLALAFGRRRQGVPARCAPRRAKASNGAGQGCSCH